MPLRPIHPRDRELQHRGDRDPDEVGHLGGSNPAMVRPDGQHHPDDCSPDNEDVDRRQRQIPHAELNRREDQIRHKVDSERQGDEERQPASCGLHEHVAKRRNDDGIEDLPDEADRLRGRRLRRLGQALIPVDPRDVVHPSPAQPPCSIFWLHFWQEYSYNGICFGSLS